MSQIAEFARQLATDVYSLNMSEEEILARFRFLYPAESDEERDRWLRAQIRAVKADPQTFQAFLS